jgi:hypothetical protein
MKMQCNEIVKSLMAGVIFRNVALSASTVNKEQLLKKINPTSSSFK